MNSWNAVLTVFEQCTRPRWVNRTSPKKYGELLLERKNKIRRGVNRNG